MSSVGNGSLTVDCCIAVAVHCTLVSFDVKSLFTSIPLQLALQLVYRDRSDTAFINYVTLIMAQDAPERRFLSLIFLVSN